MSEKRYYKREYGEEYYIFDSLIVSEDILEKRIEYEGYTAFEDSMTGDEIVNLLNEQKSFISDLLDENEEYEKESEEMQTKINVLYSEAKKHMSSTEWEKFNRRIIESEEELGIKWVRL